MTGTLDSILLMRCSSSSASPLGREKSRMATSGRNLRTCSWASRVVGASATRWPCAKRKLQIPERITGSTSMTRIRFLLKHSHLLSRKVLEGLAALSGKTQVKLGAVTLPVVPCIANAAVPCFAPLSNSQSVMLCAKLASGSDPRHIGMFVGQEKKRTQSAGPPKCNSLGGVYALSDHGKCRDFIWI